MSKLKNWASFIGLFAGTQVAAFLCLGVWNPLWVRRAGFALLLPGSSLVLLPARLTEHITDKLMFETGAVALLLGINALFWFVVVRHFARRA